MRILLLAVLFSACSIPSLSPPNKHAVKDCVKEFVKLGVSIKEALEICNKME